MFKFEIWVLHHQKNKKTDLKFETNLMKENMYMDLAVTFR